MDLNGNEDINAVTVNGEVISNGGDVQVFEPESSAAAYLTRARSA